MSHNCLSGIVTLSIRGGAPDCDSSPRSGRILLDYDPSVLVDSAVNGRKDGKWKGWQTSLILPLLCRAEDANPLVLPWAS